MTITLYFVFTVWGGVEPGDPIGPFDTCEERDAEAQRVHALQSDEDATFWMDIEMDGDGRFNISSGAYSAAFFEEGEQ
jgi:hypothetical protein